MGRGRSAAVVVLLALPACPRGQTPAGDAGGDSAPEPVAAPAPPDRLRVTRIRVRRRVWSAEAGEPPAESELQSRVKTELAKEGVFVFPPEGGREGERVADVRVSVEYGVDVVPPQGGKPTRVRAAVLMDLDGANIPLAASFLTEVEVPRRKARDLPAQAREHLEALVAEAASSLREQEAIRGGDPAQVVSALSADDADLRQVALATVAERRLTAAVPRLLELLESQDVEVRDGAIGALVALREPRAVTALTRMAKFDDVDLMRRIVDAIATIGGEEARAWLEFVAGGHENELIRAMAKEALLRMDRTVTPR